MNPILLIGAAIAAYALSRTAKAATNVTYEFQTPPADSFKVAGDNAGVMSLQFKLPIIFDNPSPQQFSFQKLYLQITKDGNRLGDTFINSPSLILPQTTTQVLCNVSMPLNNVLKQIAISGGDLTALNFKGTINEAGLNIYIDQVQDIQLPAFIKTALMAVKNLSVADIFNFKKRTNASNRNIRAIQQKQRTGKV